MAFTRVLGPGIHTQANIDSHNINSTGIITATRFDGPFTNLNVTGVTTFTGDVSIGGTLTYEDVTNIDSVGLITARDGIFLPDNKQVKLGNTAASPDFKIYHNTVANTSSPPNHLYPNSNYIDSVAASNLFIRTSTAGIYLGRTDGAHAASFHTNTAGVVLYYNASGGGGEKFRTVAKGIQVGTGVTIETNGQATYTGIVTATAFQLADGSAIGAGAGGTWSSYTAGIATTKSVGVNTSNLDDNDLVGVGNSFQGLYISNGMMITDNSLNGNHYIGTAFNGLMAGPVNIEGTLTIDGNYVVV